MLGCRRTRRVGACRRRDDHQTMDTDADREANIVQASEPSFNTAWASTIAVTRTGVRQRVGRRPPEVHHQSSRGALGTWPPRLVTASAAVCCLDRDLVPLFRIEPCREPGQLTRSVKALSDVDARLQGSSGRAPYRIRRRSAPRARSRGRTWRSEDRVARRIAHKTCAPRDSQRSTLGSPSCHSTSRSIIRRNGNGFPRVSSLICPGTEQGRS
jgi:hypothetical protein